MGKLNSTGCASMVEGCDDSVVEDCHSLVEHKEEELLGQGTSNMEEAVVLIGVAFCGKRRLTRWGGHI